MVLESMYAVDEYFDGELVEEHLFLTYEKAYAFYDLMFNKTKSTYFVRYEYRGLIHDSKQEQLSWYY